MSGALQDGLLADLVQMLGQVPRIILLILKTNDLTRSLDENLQTRQGPARQFLILARYCMRTVFFEQLEEIGTRGSLYWPPNALRVFAAWLGYVRVGITLEVFEWWIGVKRALGYQNGIALVAMA
jgi:aarF domain-containing kinase